ncbi:MAG: cytochrome c4 [Gallionella sp.]|nr:cytochrome c4 [Gallionella sp.]
MKYLCIAAFIIGEVAAGGALAVQPEASTNTEKARQIVSQVCFACHGMDGNGAEPANPEFPKIAGKQAVYLLKQLNDFKSGKRKSDIMTGIVAEISADDMSNLALYFAGQKNKPEIVMLPELLAFGKKYYEEGSPEAGVPACSGCHNPDASGTDKYPHLAGQYATYTYQQLKSFASSERENDRGLVMQSLAMRMSEQEMKAVSEYLMSLK